nr:LCP family protein [Streptomyces sp. HNM0574]
MLGYDEYGRPVYEQPPAQGGQGHDPYPAQGGAAPEQPAPQGQYGGYGGQDPYGTHPLQDPYGGHDPYGAQGGYPVQDPYGPQESGTSAPQHAQHAQQTQQVQQEWIPRQAQPSEQERYPRPADGAQEAPPERGRPDGADEVDYDAEQFAFVEESADSSEDVIDWLKFTESRTERREEAKRRGRNRITALVVVLVLAALGGTGWAWYAGKLPGVGGKSGGSTSAAGQQRDVIVVHLRSTEDGSSSTALLVDNAGAGRGTTVLLPNSLALTGEDGSATTLARSVEDEGASPTREGLGSLLGADIKGTWRLDTPYLENLVELVGTVTVDADVTVPGEKKGDKPQVRRGPARELDGRAAVAYATYRAPGETQAPQLKRFGDVMQQTLRKLSSDPDAATRTVQSLGQVPDPSLSESELGATLAKLAEQAKNGSYDTRTLPVLANGTLSRGTSEGLVKDVLGGTVKNSDPGSAPRVKVSNASGQRGADDTASAALVNGGYTVVDAAPAGAARSRSVVTYGDAKQKAKAAEVATTLGLPASAVREGESAANADVTVVLGSDYKG